MKLILILGVVLIGVWLWRTSRRSDLPHKPPPARAEPPALEMVLCQQCSVHVPAGEAIQGKNGWYCSADHLRQAEH